MKDYGTVEKKVRSIVESKFEGFEYLFADYSQTNEAVDRIHKPTILYLLPPAGRLNIHYSVVRDMPETQIWFLCPTDFDFDGKENDCLIERMKRAAIRFIHEVGESGLFEVIEGNVPYQVGYDLFDDNLTGVCITPILVEKEGLPLCEYDFDEKFTRKGWDDKR